jgi:uncharacterized membrane protein YgcG
VARGEAFTHEQRERLRRALSAAEAQTGVAFSVRIGAVEGDIALTAEHTLANLVTAPHEPAVLILVSPGQRFVRIMTTPGAKRRISDQAAGLAVLTMTSSFGLGDIVGGVINGLRQLADSSGAVEETSENPAQSVSTAG